MKYDNMLEGIFLSRPNRFIANVDIEGEVHQVHVKNTGRCREILKEGTKVYLEPAKNPNRKTKFSLISAYKDQQLINIDSQVPNQVVFQGILDGKIEGLSNTDLLKREVGYKNSRFDIYYEKEKLYGFIEVKGVTLEKDGLALFPDAPTERGRKHILELLDSLENGFSSYLIFLIQINDIHHFRPNEEMDPKFSKALRTAQEKGLKILAYNSKVTRDSIEIDKKIDIIL